MADPDKILRLIGERVRSFRTAAGMTQDDLADMIGYTRSSIANVEAGRQDLTATRIHAIAEALYVSPADLLCEPRRSLELITRLGQENQQRRQQMADAIAILTGSAL